MTLSVALEIVPTRARAGWIRYDEKTARLMDIFLCQIRGFIFGLLAALAVFWIPVWAFPSAPSLLVACIALFAMPALGFVLGTLWGSRPRQDNGR